MSSYKQCFAESVNGIGYYCTYSSSGEGGCENKFVVYRLFLRPVTEYRRDLFFVCKHLFTEMFTTQKTVS